MFKFLSNLFESEDTREFKKSTEMRKAVVRANAHKKARELEVKQKVTSATPVCKREPENDIVSDILTVVLIDSVLDSVFDSSSSSDSSSSDTSDWSGDGGGFSGGGASGDF